MITSMLLGNNYCFSVKCQIRRGFFSSNRIESKQTFVLVRNVKYFFFRQITRCHFEFFRVYQSSSSIAEKSYILTQGPVPETIGHFWTMVWQQEVSAIVMLCRLTESGTPKCASYWPQTEEDDDLIHVPSAGLEVRLRDCDDADEDYLVSNLEVRDCRSDTIRVIPHYHYMTWPDFGVPESTSTFLRFLQLVNARHPSNHANPILVHCSAGIGRSGTFILVDSCLDRMKESKKPMNLQQITDVLLTMRGMRGGLIQTPEQLKFSLQVNQSCQVCHVDLLKNATFCRLFKISSMIWA